MSEPYHNKNVPPNPGGIPNEPSRHDKVHIIVIKTDGRSMPMEVVLDWSEDLLIDEIAVHINMDKSQFYVTFGSKQLGGPTMIFDAGIRQGSEVRVNGRLRGGNKVKCLFTL